MLVIAYICAASAQCPQEKNILIYKRKYLVVQCLQEELVNICMVFWVLSELAIRFWSSLLNLMFGWIFSTFLSSQGDIWNSHFYSPFFPPSKLQEQGNWQLLTQMLMMMIYTGSKLSFGSFSTEHVFLKCIVKSGLDIDATRVERVKKYNTFNWSF